MASSNTRIQGITIEIGGKTDKLQSALKNVNSSIKKTQTALKDVNTLLKLDPKNTTLLKQKQDLLAEAVTSTKEKLEQEKLALEQLQSAGNSAETIKQQQALEREIIATTQELKKLESESKEAASVLGTQMQEAGKKISSVGDGIENAGKKMLGVTGAVTGLATASVAAAKELDAGYDTIITKTGASGEAFEQLKDVADDVFGSVATNMDDVGVAVGEVNTRFGSTGEELEKLSTSFIKFAEINGTDLNSAIDSVDAIMTKFGVDAADTENVLGLLTKAGQDSGISMGTLQSALTTNGAAFQELGLGLTESVNLLAQMESSGVDTSTAMAGLKKAVQNAAKEGKSADEALAETIESIKGAKTETEALQLATELFGSKGAAEMAQAIRDERLSIDDLSVSLDDYGNIVADTFEATQDPWDEAAIAANNLKLSAAELGGTLLETLQPVISEVCSNIKEFTTWLKNLDDNQKQTIITIAGVVAAIGPALMIIGKIVAIVGSVVTGIGTLTTTIGIATTFITGTAIPGIVGFVAAFWPLILVIGGVVAAIVAVIAIIKNWGKITEWFKEKWDKFSQAIEGISSVFEGLVEAGKSWGKDMIDNFIGGIKEKWNDLKKAVSNTAETIASYLHFSLPDVGPLSKADTWMPDMVDLLSTSLDKSTNNIEPALDRFASKISGGINSNIASASSGSQKVDVSVKLVPQQRQFFKAMVEENNNFKAITGNSAL